MMKKTNGLGIRDIVKMVQDVGNMAKHNPEPNSSQKCMFTFWPDSPNQDKIKVKQQARSQILNTVGGGGRERDITDA